MIKVLVGISGSGKSTYANTWVKEKSNRVVIGRDKIRELLFAYTESNIEDYYNEPDWVKNEKIVSEYLFKLVDYSLVQGKDVCIDNTHLSAKYLDEIKQRYFNQEIEFKVFDIPLISAIYWDSQRARKVGEKVITAQHKNFLKLKDYDFTHTPTSKKVEQNINFAPCVIFDIDGTLSNSLHRHIFSEKDEEIFDDKVILPVSSVLHSVKDWYHIIFLSGRDEKYREITTKWLKEKVGISHFDLFMRKNKDVRNDAIVKEELFKEHILPNYYTNFVVDDRLRVVKLWNDLGIFCFNVNQTGKDF